MIIWYLQEKDCSYTPEVQELDSDDEEVDIGSAGDGLHQSEPKGKNAKRMKWDEMQAKQTPWNLNPADIRVSVGIISF